MLSGTSLDCCCVGGNANMHMAVDMQVPLLQQFKLSPVSFGRVPQLFALTIPSGATLPDTSALGNFSVALANTAAGPTVSGLRSETSYRACVVAADMTRLQNKQPSVSYKDFRTLDVTPPNLVVMPTPGTDGNFTCSRWVLPD